MPATMLSPEIQRIILLIGLAATAYLLVLAWNRDYGAPELPPEVTEAPTVIDRQVPVDRDRTISDVPDPALLGEPITPVEPEAPADVDLPAQDRFVEVRTPTQHVWIDRVGGDIVRLELPRHPISRDRPDLPFVLLNNAPERVYIAQSGLMGPDGIDTGPERPLFEAEQTSYDFRRTGAGIVRLRKDTGAARFEKVFVFHENDYLIEVRYDIENRAFEPMRVAMFSQLKRGDHPAPANGAPIGLQPYLGPAVTTDQDRYLKLSFRDLRAQAFREDVDGGWVAMLQHYFLSAWVADPEARNRFFGHHRADGTFVVGFIAPLELIPGGATRTLHSRFYAGPKHQQRLSEIAPYLNLTVDYGFLWWLSIPLFQLLSVLHGVFGNWGVAIIMLTVIIKALLYPLSAASFRSMANMRRVAPQIKRLQERYGDDRQRLAQETMALYKKEKANPLGGCLPMLLQMPVFLALYWVLFESVELRHAPFMLWIRDLSAMDPFFVLPILMGASMFVQMSLNPPPPDPMQAKIMKIMPVAFTALFMFFPAGLVLYWLTNNVISIAQQWLVNRQVEGAHAAAKG
jgi:YidC/Oxa1 family membrane protein insertase